MTGKLRVLSLQHRPVDELYKRQRRLMLVRCMNLSEFQQPASIQYFLFLLLLLPCVAMDLLLSVINSDVMFIFTRLRNLYRSFVLSDRCFAPITECSLAAATA